MRPLLHPTLVNGRTGDPDLFVETQFEKRTVLFDLGDISDLPPRKIHRLECIFVSHAHIDHFIGFDRLLRLLVGRDKTIHLYGPAGFIDHVSHKLAAYRWNLVDRYLCDLVFVVTEIDSSVTAESARFRLKNAFRAEAVDCDPIIGGVIHREPAFRVCAAILEHRTACLGFAIEEATHVNVWKNRLADMGLPVGPWLRELKQAVLDNRPDDHRVRIGPSGQPAAIGEMPLGALRAAVTVTPGQKIAYVTDAADTEQNRAAIVGLARNADLLFIEATFAQADAALAAERAHLTTAAAGEIARAARVCRVEPFHFSPRYAGEDRRMLDEVMAAFAGHARASAGA
jgi:ribonuclease Z